ncbi:MAG: pyridoxal phosphate-dependent aminotransferase [Dysosmobacter sp.]|nr:pyridoxal phosphate-dependent aminotransferase [Dysosmobacter sp.]
MLQFNQEILGLQPSKSMTFMAKARQLQAADPEVVNLSGGEPDFDTPQKIREELYRQVAAGYTHYTVGAGLPELRARIVKKLKEENGCDYSPEGVVVTPGGKFAVYLAVRTFVNAGDEVMYLEPAWVSYPSIIEASGGKPVPVRLSRKDNYRITLEQLEQFVTDRTKMLIINYPNNPTGRTLTRSEADVLKQFLLRHPNLVLLADEIYERITYTGHENVSMGSYPSVADRVITMNGFSKSVAMTGWRIGYLATTPEIKAVMYKLFQHTVTCVSGFIQKAAVVALDCTEEIEEMRQSYERRRDLFVNGLNAIEGVECSIPEGAFYAWVKFDIPGMDSEGVCDYILKNAKVVGVPGVAYGTDDSCVRFSFAASEEDLKRALTQIRAAMSRIQR